MQYGARLLGGAPTVNGSHEEGKLLYVLPSYHAVLCSKASFAWSTCKTVDVRNRGITLLERHRDNIIQKA